jgi:hypothetical protein
MKCIKNVHASGFIHALNHVHNMANQLLAVRRGGEISVNWVCWLIHPRPETGHRDQISDD